MFPADRGGHNVVALRHGRAIGAYGVDEVVETGHRHVDDADRAEDGGDEGPSGGLPPLAIDDVYQDGNPAERHEDSSVLEAKDAP